jgi:hypothetical protein
MEETGWLNTTNYCDIPLEYLLDLTLDLECVEQEIEELKFKLKAAYKRKEFLENKYSDWRNHK